MKTVIQRVTSASVAVNNLIHADISKGLLVFLGIEIGDSESLADFLSDKILDLRIFSDENDKMNLSVKDIRGELLIISQFTLCTVEKSGNRPSFSNAEIPERAKYLYEYFIERTKNYYHKSKVFSGVFAEMMKINSINDGPVTILMNRK